MNDKASFDKLALSNIWGNFPRSLSNPACAADDWHHSLGRGQEFGAPPKHHHRRLFSSVFNATPIDRVSHDQEALRDFTIRCFLLDEVRKRVYEAVYNHLYELTFVDEQFLSFLALWRANPNEHKLLSRL